MWIKQKIWLRRGPQPPVVGSDNEIAWAYILTAEMRVDTIIAGDMKGS